MNMVAASPRAPAALSAESRALWKKLVDEYGIADAAGLVLLQTALEARERMRQCQRAIKRDGTSVKDRFGQVKPHPLLPAERDARSGMMAAFRALNLDVEPLNARAGRP